MVPRMKISLVLTALALALTASVRAANDDEPVSRLNDQIKTVKSLAAETSGAADKQRLERRLGSLQQELAVAEKRQSIEARGRRLRAAMLAQTRELLREQLDAVPADTAAAETLLHELAGQRSQATAERAGRLQQRDELRPTQGETATVLRAEIDGRIANKNEQLRAIVLQQEAAQTEIDLIRQAQVLRERLRASETKGSFSLRALFEQRLLMQDDSTADIQLKARLANVADNLENSGAEVSLTRQRIEKIDEEPPLAQRPAGSGRSNPRVDQFNATEQAQKQLLVERLPYLAAQVAALERTQDQLQTRQDLGTIERRFLKDQFRDTWMTYLRHLVWPALLATALILVYTVISRAVLPRHYQKEELFLARRLGRYATILLATAVVATYMIDDITALATTLGLLSAAIVISLQDVCASFFAWFVIMLGRKFTIGDRLEIDGSKGDVLDIQLLRTTLIELNSWLGSDHPTGRIIVFPNNLIFKTKIFNYSHGHPYIWSKVDVTVTYATPVASAMALFRQVLEEETKENFVEAQKAATAMQDLYGVEDADYRPKIVTHITDSGVTFTLIYVSHYREASIVRNRINRRLIAELETHHDVQLAYTTYSVLASRPTPGPSAVFGKESIQASTPAAGGRS